MTTISIESEAGFRALFEHASVGILVINKDGIIELCNPLIEKLFGYVNAELLGQQVEILIPTSLRTEHADLRINFFENPAARPMGMGLALKAQRKNGDEFPVEISLGHYPFGGELLAVAFITDISERKKTEEKLREREEQYRLAFSGIHESFMLEEIIINEKGKISDLKFLDVNTATEKLFGKRRDEIIGHYRSELLGPLSPKLLSIIEQVDNTGATIREEQFMASIDKWFDRFFYRSRKGQIATLNLDITAQKSEEESLRLLNDSGNRLWRATNFESGIDEILNASIRLTGADMGNVQLLTGDKRVLHIAAQKGFTTEFLDFFREVSADDDSACGRSLRYGQQITLMDTEEDEAFAPFRPVARQAGFRSVMSTPLFTEDGSAIGIVSVHFRRPNAPNVHLLSRLELYARKAESFIERYRIYAELENKVEERTKELIGSLEREKELSEMKSHFVSFASHEFRTPLATIMSSLSLVESYNKEEQESKRKKHIDRIKSSIANLVDILNDFLSVEKLEQGKVEAHNELFDLRNFCEEVTAEISPMLKSGQQIHFSYNGVIELKQDKKILRNILLNLLSNAIKYSKENCEIYFSGETSEKLITIVVKDNGIGIPIDEQAKLFGTFYRASNSSGVQGTGLGLNIVKKYVDLIKGNISFTSIENEGTTFTVNIEIAD